MRKTLVRYARLVPRARRGQWVAVVVFALIASGLEAVGAVLVYLLVGLTTDPAASLEVPLVGDLRARLPELAPEQLITATAIGVAVFFVVRAGVKLSQSYFQARVANQTSVDIATALFARYLRLPYSFHLRRNSSELIRNASESVNEILGSVLMPMVRLVAEGFMILGLVAVLLYTAPAATAAVAVVLGVFVLFVLRVVQPRMGRLGAISQREHGAGIQALQQGLHGYRDITVLGRQQYFEEVYRSARLKIARARWLRAMLGEFPRVAIEALVVGLIALFLVVSTQTGGGAAESLPVLGLFAYAALRLMPSLNEVVRNLNSLRFGRAAVQDVEADLDLKLPFPVGEVARLDMREALRLEHVTFVYDGAEEPTLEDIDLMVARGESVGVVGATGAGKSTLTDLLLGLSVPTHGRVTVDGQDLREVAPSFQRSVGMVSQEVFLLDDTLRHNIALGVPPSEIDEERVAQAVGLAQLDEFVASLPEGLDTWVGERGVRVSGGQRQRVAIARALYPDPSLLVFDEGTSALDNLTEAMLIESLEQLQNDRTIITVAHRLSTVRDHDKIVFMRDGRIDDVGSYDELGARNPEFRRLARWAASGAAPV